MVVFKTLQHINYLKYLVKKYHISKKSVPVPVLCKNILSIFNIITDFDKFGL